MAENSNAIRAGAAFVEIFTKPNFKGLDDFANRLKHFGAGTMKVGAGVLAGGLGLLAPVAALFKGGLDMAGQLQDLQDQFGLTAEGVSKLGYAAQVAGAGLDELEPILKGLAKANTDGRPLDQFALDFADSLLAIEDPSERARTAMDQLGKGGLKFLKVAGDLKGLFGEAPLIDQATLDASDSFGQSLSKIGVYAKSALLPFAEYAAGAATAVAQLVRENAPLLRVVAAVGAALAAAGVAIIAFGGAVSVAGMGLSALLAVWGAVGAAAAFLASPLGVVVASFVALAGILNHISGGGVVGFFTGWGEAFAEIGRTAQATMGGITDALKGGDLALAGRIGLAGLKVVWETVLAEMTLRWERFKDGFTMGWEGMTDSVAIVFVKLIGVVGKVLRSIIDSITGAAADIAGRIGGDRANAIVSALGAITAIHAGAGGTDAGADKRGQEIIDSIKGDAAQRKKGTAQLDLTGANAAKAELDRLLAEAAGKANKAKPEEKRQMLDEQIGGATRGAFKISQNAAAQFGIGESVNQQIATNTKQAAEEAKKQTDLLTDLPNKIAAVTGLRFN